MEEMKAEMTRLDSFKPSPNPSTGSTDSSVNRDVAQLQERLRRIEEMKGLDAKISEVKKQVRKLNDQIKNKEARIASIKSSVFKSSSTATSTTASTPNTASTSASMKQPPFDARYSRPAPSSSARVSAASGISRNDAVERELMKLKQEMNKKK